MALHLKKLENRHLLAGFERPYYVVSKECPARFVGTIENDANVVVAARPRIAEILLQPRFEDGSQFIAQPVKRGTKGNSPLLVPRVSTRITSAIAAPTLDAVDTAPGTIFNNLNHVFGGMFFQELAIVGELCDGSFVDFVQG